MNKFGIFMNFWENTWLADHIKYIEKARNIGFDVLEFQAQPLLEMSEKHLDEIKAAAKEQGIELTYSLGLDKAYDIASPDASVRKRGIQYLSDIMDRVHYMDGKIISGVSYAGWGVPESQNIDKKELTAYSVHSMKELSKLAEEYDITYGVEAVNRFEGVVINTAAEARSYVEAVDSPMVGILLDTYHMNIEESNIGEAIRLAGDKLVGFHTGENNRAIPGKGHLDWDEIFNALVDINYTGRIVSEPFIVQGGEVGRAIYVWRDLIDNTDEANLDAEVKVLLEFEQKMLKKAWSNRR